MSHECTVESIRITTGTFATVTGLSTISTGKLCPGLNELKDKKKVSEKVTMINHDSGQYFVTDLKHQIGNILDNEDALRSDFCNLSENETDDFICK